MFFLTTRLGKYLIYNIFLHRIPMLQHDLRFVLRFVLCVNNISDVSFFVKNLENIVRKRDDARLFKYKVQHFVEDGSLLLFFSRLSLYP